jgi:hypothetical protein
MTGLKYTISLPAASQLQISAGINAKVLPLMHQAVKAIAQQTAANWQEAIYKAKLWSGEKDAYAASISWTMTGDFSAFVSSDYKHAAEIETGRPPRDLKKMLDTSLKVRISQKGKRFLVIPFRHNTPGNTAHAAAMPGMVFGLAKAMAPSTVLSVGQRPSGEITHLSPKTGMHPAADQKPFASSVATQQSHLVAKRNYAWGDRITAGMLKQAGADKETIRRHQGMVKMDTSSGKQKSSAYLTFRIMMEGSKGWIVPAQPGQYIVQKVAQEMEPKAKAAFEQAVKLTMKG